MAVPVALLAWAPRPGGLPEVERGFARCPADDPPGRSGTGPLVPDARYHLVQLCPRTPSAQERTPFRILDDHTSAEIVDRLNALSAAPPSPACGTTAVRTPVDLVLRAGRSQVVVRLDTGPCGSARRDGVVRYGAAGVHRYTAELLEK